MFKQSDPELWKFLTARNTLPCAPKMIGNEMDNTALLKEKEMRLSSVLYPTEMHNIHGPSISSRGIVDITPGKGHFPVSFFSEQDKHLLFLKTILLEKITAMKKENYPSKYIYDRLKCCNDDIVF